ncbi:MAG: hypothetical protein JXA57_10830 [Armatimonadetes bacterium]|nr:hypothetical protein [Armatimonadota bacterium]
MERVSPLPTGNGRSLLAQLRSSTRVSAGALGACAVVAISLAVVLGADNAAYLPLNLGRYTGLTLGLAVAVGLTTLVWPELAVPAIIIGAGLLDSQLGHGRVRHLVFVKLALFGCGGLGVVLATAKRHSRMVRVHTPGDAPALCLVCYTALSAAYAYLYAGYDLDSVAVAGYHLSQLALYHFLVTTTLGRPDSLRRAGLITVAWSVLWIIPSLLTPGRGGGTATMWLIVLLCYTTASRSSWGLLAWTALPLALLDTLTSGYRTLWVSVAAQVGWLANWGLRSRLRPLRGTAVALAALCLLTAGVLATRSSVLTSLPAASTLDRFSASVVDGGYRVPEALIGLAAFRQSPVFGLGVGYHTPPIWVETMGYMSVGPIYHVYYVSYLASQGIFGLGLVFWYFLAVLFSREARTIRRDASASPWAALAVGLQAAFVGAILAAFFSGPSDGHWTWGVLGAGSLLPAMWATQQAADSRWREAEDREVTPSLEACSGTA